MSLTHHFFLKQKNCLEEIKYKDHQRYLNNVKQMGQGNQLEGKHQEEGSRQGVGNRQGEGNRQEEGNLLVGILLGEGSPKVGSRQGEGNLLVGIPVVDNHVEGMVRLEGNVHQHSQQDLKTVPCL
jgi:hypothetical protein